MAQRISHEAIGGNGSMTNGAYSAAMHAHVHAFFGRHTASDRAFDKGPIRSVVPGFHAVEVAPGPKLGLWTYVSVGAGLLQKPGGLQVEFVLVAPDASDRHVELLAMTTYYHRTQTL